MPARQRVPDLGQVEQAVDPGIRGLGHHVLARHRADGTAARRLNQPGQDARSGVDGRGAVPGLAGIAASSLRDRVGAARRGRASRARPRPRSTRSIAGIALSSAPVLSVIRNSRKALFCTMLLARAGSAMPGELDDDPVVPRPSGPRGSATPNSSMRLRSTVSARSMSRLGIGRHPLALIELERQVHAALEVEAALERHPRDLHVAHDAVLPPLADRLGPREEVEDR